MMVWPVRSLARAGRQGWAQEDASMRMKRAGVAVMFLATFGVVSAGCAQVLGIEDWEPQATGGGGTGAAGGGGDPSAGGGGSDASGPTTTTTTSTGTGTGPICGQASTTPVAPCACNVCNPDNPSKCYDDCTNGSKDFSESDVDCGGPYCLRCQPGQGCQRDCDCATKNCVLGTCSLTSNNEPDKCTEACNTSE